MPRTPEAIQDELLVLRCQDGDAEALSDLVARWRPRLLAHAGRLTGDPAAADDAVQEAWLAIVSRLGRLDDPARFGVWARRIVTNKCADWIRRRQRDRRAVAQAARNASGAEAPPASEIEQAEETGAANHALRRAMRDLSSEHRAALALHYLDGLSVRDVAAALGVPEGTVKSRLHHARRRLEEAWRRAEERSAP